MIPTVCHIKHPTMCACLSARNLLEKLSTDSPLLRAAAQGGPYRWTLVVLVAPWPPSEMTC